MIRVEHLTKSYGPKKGVFDLSFEVKKGEIFGFIGPNGAGKTTTIRQLLGFIKSDSGLAFVNDLESFHNAAAIQEKLGYLPGEIAFFDQMSGDEFLRFLGEMRGLPNDDKMQELKSFLELDASGRIKKMSKGMKQKLGLVAAFMHDPEILILDEPTSGLDPLMQSKFVELILKEKAKGKTILMSSHSFEEIERTCDRALIIKEGQMVALEDIKKLKQEQRKVFLVGLENMEDVGLIQHAGFEVKKTSSTDVEVVVTGDIQPFIQTLAKVSVKSLDVKNQSLEEIFMDYYQEEDHE